MGIDWGAQDDWAQRVTREADAVRSVPGHGLTDGQAYLVAAGRVVERRLVFMYRLMVWGGTLLALYVGWFTWHDSGSFRDSLAPMAISMWLFSAVAFRLTRRMRWAGFSVGPYAREVEASLRRAQGGIHLIKLSGGIVLASLFFYAICVSWAFPLS
ncbi:hypothetical protein AB0A69_07955 [Streptomyces sp. NPDC045431]|uniref:hypothetical protein n=1 Tax=Streptomyces sp. NPDC045431 TaxID=3155613 RepID=UPI00340F749F